MKLIRRLLSLALTAALLCSLCPAFAADSEEPWSRREPGGEYVTVRVPCPQGEEMSWADTRNLMIRFGDTKQPVPLTSEYVEGYLFATLPAADAGRPLECYSGTPIQFQDHLQTDDVYDAPLGTSELNLRGLIQGDGSGNLNASRTLTRAEAFAAITRLLSLQPQGDPGYGDVDSGDWFRDVASASRAAGIASEAEYFYPLRTVSRGEMTVMLYRAMGTTGWVSRPEGTAEDLPYRDAASIPDWALDAYLALCPHGVEICDQVENGSLDSEGMPATDPYAYWDRPCTREEMIILVYNGLRRLPWYPKELAIRLGFDKEMPVIDGSTSTLPYSQTVYHALFHNADSHPQYPWSNSKSFYAYDRLIRGEADLLFASTEPTQEILRRAEEAGVELELVPMARDAMVFFTSAENPAQGITSDQIRRIYVDNAYDNWSQLGGPEAHFVPYCRNADSGSQAQMEKFFLEGKDIHPDIRRETTSTSMQSVITDVYNAARPAEGEKGIPTWALGYSIYYYYLGATTILLPENALKLLPVDGVLPSDGTIADGTYPLSGYNYAVVRKDSPQNSLGRAMVDFMLSEEGQNCVESAGYGRLNPQET